MAVLIAISCPLAGRATSVTNGLIAHLKFDGDYKDATTNAVDGAPVGTPTFEAGILGQAIHIISATDNSTNHYVTLGYPSVLKFGSDATGDATDFSIAFWTKVFSQSDDKPWISNKDWNSLSNLGWVIATEADGMKWNLRDDLSGRRDSPHVAPQLNDHNWHHVLVTFQRNTNARIYIDGVLVNTANLAPDAGNPIGALDTDDRGLSVNLGQDGTGEYTDGNAASVDLLMDDLGIWRRIVTSAEAAEIYHKGVAGKTLEQEGSVVPTVITSQPTNVIVVVGLRAAFKVGATGSGLVYQWKLNGTNLPAQTNSSFVIAAAASADAGSYSVVVTGQGGTQTSNPATLSVSAAPVNCTITDRLIAHLKFENDYSDASGNGVNGRAVGAPAFAKGMFGNAVHIISTKNDGTNDYVTLGYPEALKFGTNDFSFSFWVKIFSQSDNQPFISNKDWISVDNRGYIVSSQADGISWNLRDDLSGPRDSPHVGPELEQDGNWHHMAVTFARNSDGKIYIDGNLENTISVAPDAGNPVGNIDTDDLGLQVNLGQDGTGNYTDNNAAGIDMLMDDLAIWRRALTADEVVCIVSHGRSGQSLDQVAGLALRIESAARIGDNVMIHWSGGPGIRLQKATSLTDPIWQDLPGTEASSSFSEPVGNGNTFYRLSKT